MFVWKSFLLAFTALLPLINPPGTALILLGLVGDQPAAIYSQLARRIAVATTLFLVVIQFLGTLLLAFFGISLPIVQVTGGLIIAAAAWSLLFERDAHASTRDKHEEIAGMKSSGDDLNDKIFYPFTFPITAGPGTLVIMLTLSAKASAASTLAGRFAVHTGNVLAVVAISLLVYVSYRNAPALTRRISPSTIHGILRVVAFILMCLGVQIAWNGGAALLTGLLLHTR